ncbi:anti-sigma factor [uncultured Serinicoccus sp.]|uniref:anti-sigma factor n=1 Tax=uncultured Serinicoccus sp. TaxID=735514 RepID=UPI002628CBFE|nr:anti-sigma factor [uncultured Serinicoccus sp.]
MSEDDVRDHDVCDDARGDDEHAGALAYAIHALDDDEQQEFEAHLAGCPSCQDEVDATREAMGMLSEDLAVEPPPGLRSRVLQQVAAEAAGAARQDVGEPAARQDADVTSLASRRSRSSAQAGRRPSVGRWLAAAAAAVVLAGGVWGISQTLDPDPTREVLQADDASEHTADTEAGPVAVTVSDAAGQAVVQLPGDFAAPQAGQVYQAWFVGPDGSARSAGLLTAQTVSEGRSLLEGAPEDAVAVGLTVEPEGGSSQPTSEPFVVVPLT